MAEEPETDAQRLGRAIQVRRAELGMKRPDLAKRAELSYPYVSEIENGMKMPSTKALGQLAQALGMTMTELMGQAEDVDLFDDADAGQMPLALALRAQQSQQRRFALRDEPFEQLAQLDRRVARFEPAPQSSADRRLEELIRTIVRAEMAAWVRTELPGLIRRAIGEALEDGD